MTYFKKRKSLCALLTGEHGPHDTCDYTRKLENTIPPGMHRCTRRYKITEISENLFTNFLNFKIISKTFLKSWSLAEPSVSHMLLRDSNFPLASGTRNWKKMNFTILKFIAFHTLKVFKTLKISIVRNREKAQIWLHLLFGGQVFLDTNV